MCQYYRREVTTHTSPQSLAPSIKRSFCISLKTSKLLFCYFPCRILSHMISLLNFAIAVSIGDTFKTEIDIEYRGYFLAVSLTSMAIPQEIQNILANRMRTIIIGQPGIAMPPAGLCFTDVIFWCRPVIRQRMDGSQRQQRRWEHYCSYKCGALWSSNPEMMWLEDF